ncbi:MAG: rRNA pseudouridine synthase [Clostridia bacterium]|nr:rRNA pseudouridine synthase [Clostridia bacterium]
MEVIIGMRLDKFIAESGLATRTEIAKAARSGAISVNGQIVRKAGSHIDPTADVIVYCGREVVYREFTYVMLNKPEGYVSSTDDDKSPTVLTLLPDELQRIGLFPCGRLDKNTLGLMILTNNGPLSHKLLAPKNHVSKKYRFTVKFPISESDVSSLESGVDIGGYVTAPCQVEMADEKNGYITLTEGKYHQIKLMAEAVHNQITYLERVTFGPVSLDTSLERGQWRYLTAEEQTLLESHGKSIKDTHSQNGE